jgi:predicted metal-dependent enzyme (double-stranded beta helix superfamily)
MATALLSPPAPSAATTDILSTIAAGLARAVTGAELSLAGGQQRAFVRLLAAPQYEAWLIAWAPAGGLALHDHGGSAGAVHVARGRLAETYLDAHDGDGLQDRTVPAGAGVAVPASRIHEVWNPGPALALSVHVYSPPLTSMTFFDVAEDGAVVPSSTRRGDVVALEGTDDP